MAHTDGRECECPGCHRLLEGKQELISFGKGVWHAGCLRCAKCTRTPRGDEALVLADGQPLCARCVRACDICHKPITTHEAILAGEHSYHAACFVCKVCRQPITELVFAKASSGIYCMTCHQLRVAAHAKQRAARKQKHKQRPSTAPESPAAPGGAAPVFGSADGPVPHHRPTSSLEVVPNPLPPRRSRRPSVAASGQPAPSVVSSSNPPLASSVSASPSDPEAKESNATPLRRKSHSSPALALRALQDAVPSAPPHADAGADDLRHASSADDLNGFAACPSHTFQMPTKPRVKKVRMPAGASYALDQGSPTSGLFDTMSDKESTSTSISSAPARAPALSSLANLALTDKDRRKEKHKHAASAHSVRPSHTDWQAREAESGSPFWAREASTAAGVLPDVDLASSDLDDAAPSQAAPLASKAKDDKQTKSGDAGPIRAALRVALAAESADGVIVLPSPMAGQLLALISPEGTYDSTAPRGDSHPASPGRARAHSVAQHRSLLRPEQDEGARDALLGPAAAELAAFRTAVKWQQDRLAKNHALDKARRERRKAKELAAKAELREIEKQLARLRSECELKTSEMAELVAGQEAVLQHKHETPLFPDGPSVELERSLSRRLERVSATFRSELDSLVEQRDNALIELEELSQSKDALVKEKQALEQAISELQKERNEEQQVIEQAKHMHQRPMRALPEPPLPEPPLPEPPLPEPPLPEPPSPDPSPSPTFHDPLATGTKMLRWIKQGPGIRSSILPSAPRSVRNAGMTHSASGPSQSSLSTKGLGIGPFAGSSTSLTSSMGGLYSQFGGSTPSLLISHPNESNPDLSLTPSVSHEQINFSTGFTSPLPSTLSSKPMHRARTTSGPTCFTVSGASVAKEGQHDLLSFTAVRPTRCVVCQRSMWGQTELRCSLCNQAMHRRCANEIRVPVCEAASLHLPLVAPPLPPHTGPIQSASASDDKVGCTFGEDLSVQASLEGRSVPRVVTKCIEAIEATALGSEGIYRQTGGSGQVALITSLFEQGAEFDLTDRQFDRDAIGSVLKNYFRSLPSALISAKVQATLATTMESVSPGELMANNGANAEMRAALRALPKVHLASLAVLVRHLHRVQLARGRNLMTARNLGTVFGPTLFSTHNPAHEFAHLGINARIVEYLILHPNVLDDA